LAQALLLHIPTSVQRSTEVFPVWNVLTVMKHWYSMM
jgi:hypothetical protein